MSKKEPSQKLFTVQFTDENNECKTTKVLAKKGKSLKDAIEPILTNYELSFNSHAVFLEASSTPLPLTNDVFPYGGLTLQIRAIEEVNVDKRIVTMMRSESKKGLQNDKRKRFSELLLSFDVNGFGDTNGDVTDGVDDVKENDEFYLESSWKEIITELEGISDKQRVQQEAIWELFSTEVSYLKDLKIIIDIFQRCFDKVQDEGYLKDVEKSLIFANVEEVYEVNRTFWRGLKVVVEDIRKTKLPINPTNVMKAFDDFEELFEPYIKYCNADTSNMKLPTFDNNTTEMVNMYVAWCDNHEQCKRIKLQGFLIKPLQRVTKYSLLLRAILNKTEDENERNMISEVMTRVETFVSQINRAVHVRQEYEKLVSTVTKFECYRPTEGVTDEAERVIGEYCSLDLKGSMPGLDESEKRRILKEGPMKLVDKQGKKDVFAFLFTDVLIISKVKKNIDKQRIIRPPYRLNKILLRPLKESGNILFLYLNEYGVASSSFCLQINTNEQAQWLSAIETAKENYEKLRTEYGLREKFLDDDLPGSEIRNNIPLKRVERPSKPTQETSQSKSVQYESPIDMSNTKLILCVTAFAFLNILMTKLFTW